MDSEDLRYALELEEQAAVDHDIDSIPAVETNALVLDWEGHLQNEGDAGKGQFPCEALFIDRLQQARSKRAVHFQCTSDYPIRKWVEIHFAVLLSVETSCLRAFVV